MDETTADDVDVKIEEDKMGELVDEGMIVETDAEESVMAVLVLALVPQKMPRKQPAGAMPSSDLVSV